MKISKTMLKTIINLKNKDREKKIEMLREFGVGAIVSNDSDLFDYCYDILIELGVFKEDNSTDSDDEIMVKRLIKFCEILPKEQSDYLMDNITLVDDYGEPITLGEYIKELK